MTHGGQNVWMPPGYPFSSFPCPDCNGRAGYKVVYADDGWIAESDNDDGNVAAVLGEHTVKT